MRYIVILFCLISISINAQTVTQPGLRDYQLTGATLPDSVLYIMGTDTLDGSAKQGLGKWHRADLLSNYFADTDWLKLGSSTLIPTNSDSAYRSGYTLFKGLNGGLATKIEMLKEGILQFDQVDGGTSRYIYKYKPLQQTEGNVSFNSTMGSIANSGIDRNNDTHTLGFNFAPGGGVEVAGKSGIGLHFENFYRSGGTDYAEFHLVCIDTLGVVRKPYTTFFNIYSPATWAQAWMGTNFKFNDPTNNLPFIEAYRDGTTGAYMKMLGSAAGTGAAFYVDDAGDNMQITSEGMTNPHLYLFDDEAVSFVHMNYLNFLPSGNPATSIVGYGADNFATTLTYPVLADSLDTYLSGSATNLSIAQSGGTQVIQSSTGTDVGVRNLYGLLITEGATDTLHFKVDSSKIATQYDITQIPINSIKAATATNTAAHTNYAQEWTWNTLAGATGLKLSSTSTVAASNLHKLFEVSTTGANGSSGQSTYGGYFSNTHTGTTSTNYGLYSAASGAASANYAIYGEANGSNGYGVAGTSTNNIGIFGAGAIGVHGSATSGIGVDAHATSGLALSGTATSGTGIEVVVTSGIPMSVQDNAAGTNTVEPMIQMYHLTTGTAAAGIGSSIVYNTEASDGSDYVSNTLKSTWTTATAGSRVSNFIITGVNAATEADIMTLKGSKQIQVHGYGTGGTFTASPVADLFVDATGNLVQGSMTGQSWTADADDATTPTLISNQTLKIAGGSGITTDLFDNATTDSITIAVNGKEFTKVTTLQSDDFVLLHDSISQTNERILWSDVVIDLISFKDGNTSVGTGNAIDVGEGLDIAMSPSTEANINLDASEFLLDGTNEGDESILVYDPDTTAGHRIQRLPYSVLSGGSDTNFAEDDLTFTGNRSHDLGANTLLLHGTVGNVTFKDDNGGTGDNIVIVSELGVGTGVTGGISFESQNSGTPTDMFDLEANKIGTNKSSFIIKAEQATDAHVTYEKNAGLSDNTTESHFSINGGMSYTQNYVWTATGADLTIDRGYYNIVVTGAGAIGDEINLPEVNSTVVNWAGASILSDAQVQVGQEYVITTRRNASTGLVLRAFTGDLINGQASITLPYSANGTSVILKCNEFTAGVGYWYTY